MESVLQVVFHPEAMFPSHSPWNGGGGEHGDATRGAVVTSDYQHAHTAFEQYQDSISAVAAGNPNQNLAAVAHVFKQPVSDDSVEYVPEAKRLAYAPSPFINKSPGSPYCENGSINSPMSVAAATSLDAYNQSLQHQQQPHHLDQSNYDQSSVPNSDLNAAAAQQLHSHMHHEFNPLSPFTQQASATSAGGPPPGTAPGQSLTPISAAAAAHASMLAQQSEMIQASSNAAVAAAAHSNLNQLPSYPAMSGSPRSYLTPSPGGAADSAALAAASGAALNRYGGGPIYAPPPQSSAQLTRPLSPVMICDLAQRQLGGGPPPSFPSHYLPSGLPTAANNAAAAGHQMSSMHASQFPPQSPHGLGPGPLMRMGFPYRYSYCLHLHSQLNFDMKVLWLC